MTSLVLGLLLVVRVYDGAVAPPNDRGLMRAYWSESALQSRVASDWLFTRREAQAIAAGLAKRRG